MISQAQSKEAQPVPTRAVVARPAIVGFLFAVALGAAPHRLCAAPPHFAADRPLDMRHIRLDVTVDLEAKTLEGVATLSMTAQRPVRSIALHAVDFKVRGTKLALKDQPANDCEFENDGRMIRIPLEREIDAGTALRVEIEYSVKDPPRGLSFFAPSDEEPDAPLLAWTQGQTTTNRYWVPCFDHPNDRQTTEVICRTKKPFMAISNGRLEREKDNGDGTRTFHWVQDKDHAVYLMTLVVGEFVSKTETWRGKPVIYYVRPKYEDRIDGVFGNTTRMLDFFSDRIGIEYPWDKYAQICCYAFGGGMENTSATTLGEGILRDERGRLTATGDDLIAHELAHQWWGDLLTCREWAHTWLNEGFATYFEALWEEHDKGPDAFANDMRQKLRSALRAGRDKPIVHRDYADEDEQFDGRAYPKGAWVLHMIRRRLGDELFWKCMKTYGERFAHKTVETVDLRKTIEEVTGRSFERFFHDWTERPGHPEVTVTYAWNPDDSQAEVRVRQTQRADAFHFPLTLEFHSPNGRDPHVVTKEITEKDVRIVAGLSRKPSLLRVDPHQAVLMDLKIEMTRDLWAARLVQDDNAAARISAVEQLTQTRTADDVKLLAEQLEKERFWAVQTAIASALRTIAGETARDALLAHVDTGNPRVRAAIVEALGGFKKDARVQKALRGIIDKGDPSTAVEVNAIEAYAASGANDVADLLRACMKRDSDREVIRSAALRGIGQLRDAASLDTLVEWSQAGKPLECRSAAVAGLGRLLADSKLDVESRKQAFDAVRACLDVKARRLQMAALNALGGIAGDRAAAAEAVERVASEAQGRMKSMADRIVQRLRDGDSGERPAGTSRGSDDLRRKVAALEDENTELRERLDRLEARLRGGAGDRPGGPGGRRRGARGEDASAQEAPNREDAPRGARAGARARPERESDRNSSRESDRDSSRNSSSGESDNQGRPSDNARQPSGRGSDGGSGGD